MSVTRKWGRVHHNPRCRIFGIEPGLRSDDDCNCGAIPALPEPQPMPQDGKRKIFVCANAVQELIDSGASGCDVGIYREGGPCPSASCNGELLEFRGPFV